MKKEEYNTNNVEIPEYRREEVQKTFKRILKKYNKNKKGRSNIIADTKKDLIKRMSGSAYKVQDVNRYIENRFSKAKYPTNYKFIDFK